ncbi:YceI family protein [Pseudobacteriovorax antillogorgiicola]|uniref:Polyisoprenoid-binding protein YceI n=1 Tax=Pseudobacteriovorax antillogorgiicola TaxID=1513793 RepID=A0A1Y6BPI7_9BACT|nr:YceI family protein [Pseudobacteriovorax antillogorgiicola]TCS55371.1 polyisoprenoid-binding protein YceI [Pseudobacteriovorax antillogorgiicola]SMF13444.1 Polyisoprenoid-binding protein YceI [Pseudobacteriovorax antillogorgiicola]
MIKLLVPLMALTMFYSNGIQADVHKIDRAHSSINFKIRHLFAKVTGQFKSFSGNIQYFPENVKKSKFTLEIDASSISTDHEKRDNHLRSADFFWVEKHPKILFSSKRVEDAGENRMKVIGHLTMRGVTKPIEVTVSYLGQVADPWGTTKAGFEANAKLNRKDFEITWNKSLDSGGVILGDMVDIEIFLETINESASSTP